MITDNMRAWGLIFANSMKRLKNEGYSDLAAAYAASAEAAEVFPLEEAEQQEVRRLSREGHLGDLVAKPVPAADATTP
jgi:hypothetical protein